MVTLAASHLHTRPLYHEQLRTLGLSPTWRCGEGVNSLSSRPVKLGGLPVAITIVRPGSSPSPAHLSRRSHYGWPCSPSHWWFSRSAAVTDGWPVSFAVLRRPDRTVRLVHAHHGTVDRADALRSGLVCLCRSRPDTRLDVRCSARRILIQLGFAGSPAAQSRYRRSTPPSASTPSGGGWLARVSGHLCGALSRFRARSI
jgi:hypothetical protein